MEMQLNWWQPFLLILTLGALGLLVHLATRRRFYSHSVSYRKSYLEIIRRLEALTLRLNRLSSSLSFVREAKIIEAYEACLRQFEVLLSIFRSLSPFGRELAVISSATHLVEEIDRRVLGTERVVQAQMLGRSVNVSSVVSYSKQQLPVGCYFCSKPFTYAGLVPIKAKIEGHVKIVSSCSFCRTELQKKRKVKILYFVKEGRPVHWSNVTEYDPFADYWDLQRQSMLIKNSRFQKIDQREEDIDP